MITIRPVEWVKGKWARHCKIRDYYTRLDRESDERSLALGAITELGVAATAELARGHYTAHQYLMAEISRIRDQMEKGAR